MQINLINYVTEEEIKAMPLVDLEVTKSTITNKNSNVRRDTYSAMLKFDRLAHFKLNITNDDFALLHYFSGKQFINDQFNVRAHVRFVETKWPEKDGREAHSSYRIDIYVTEDLRWSFDITKSQFLPVLKMGIKAGSSPSSRSSDSLASKKRRKTKNQRQKKARSLKLRERRKRSKKTRFPSKG